MLLFRYFTREIYTVTLAIVLVVLAILISTQFLHYMGHVASGQITVAVLLKLMAVEVPLLLGYLMPLSFFLGVILAMGQFCMQNEIAVMQACGVGHVQRLKWLAVLAIGMAIFTSVVMFWIEPGMQRYRLNLLDRAALSYSIEKVAPNSFQRMAGGEMYVGDKTDEGQVLHNVFVALPMKPTHAYPHGSTEVVRAKLAKQTFYKKVPEPFVVLEQGGVVRSHLPQKNLSVTHFQQYGIRLDARQGQISAKDEIKLDSTVKLWRMRHNPHASAELQWRLAMPLSLLILAAIALPLSYIEPRQGKFGRFFPAILLYMVYMNFIFVCRGWIYSGKLSGWLGMWWLHAIFLSLAVVFNWRALKR